MAASRTPEYQNHPDAPCWPVCSHTDCRAMRSLIMSRYTDAYGRNVQNILIQATRVIRSPIPRQVRNELMTAVKAGALGRLKKDGLKPEIFYHPDHKHGAIERQNREALFALQCISKVVAHGAERAEYDISLLRSEHPTD